jgi:hypothetical protein
MPHCSMNVKRFCALQQEAVRQEPRPGSRDQDRRGPGALWPRWLERERVSNRENSPRLAADERNAAPGQLRPQNLAILLGPAEVSRVRGQHEQTAPRYGRDTLELVA